LAQVLEEFLVSVRYAVDAASQQRFHEAINQVAGRVSKAAAEVTALVGSITAMAKVMADAGEKMFFMSMRLGESAAGIETATYAMERFGVSAEEAKASMEGFGSFLRSYGPAATAFLGSLGITARDTIGQTQQLTAFFQRIGLRPGQEGTMGYAMGLQYAHLLGISESAARAYGSGETQQGLQRGYGIMEKIWGVQTVSQVDQKVALYTKAAHDVMNVFRDLGFLMHGLWDYFAANFLPKILPELQKFYDAMERHLPAIKHALEVAGDGLVIFVHYINELGSGIEALISTQEGAIAFFGAIGAALLALAWPLIAVVAGIASIADFASYLQKHPDLFNWEGLFGDPEELKARVHKTLDGLFDGFRQDLKWIRDDLAKTFGDPSTWLGRFPQWLKEQGDELDRINEKFKSWGRWLRGQAGEDGKPSEPLDVQLNKIMKASNDAGKATHDWLAKMWEDLVKWNQETSPLKQLTRDWENLRNVFQAIGAAFDKFWDKLTHISVDRFGNVTFSSAAEEADKATDRAGYTGTNRNNTPLPQQAGPVRDLIMKTMGWSKDMADVVASYVGAESQFQPGATNEASGAHGLFQLIPSRWKRAVAALRKENPDFDPETPEGEVAMFKWETEHNPVFAEMITRMQAMISRGDLASANALFLRVFGAGHGINDYGEDVNYNANQIAAHAARLGTLHNTPVGKQQSFNLGPITNTFAMQYGPTAHATASAIQDRMDLAQESLVRMLGGAVLA
jgi:hypothetical protein